MQIGALVSKEVSNSVTEVTDVSQTTKKKNKNRLPLPHLSRPHITQAVSHTVQVFGEGIFHLFFPTGAANPDEAADYVRTWSSSSDFGPEAYQNGMLPAGMPLNKFREYQNQKPPEEIQHQCIAMRTGDDFAIPNPEGYSFTPIQAILGLDGKTHVKPNTISTMAERNEAKSPNLPNIISMAGPRGKLTFRCGVIDTFYKANQFLEGLKHLYQTEEVSLDNIRIVMNQLNVPGVAGVGEKKLIENQDKQAQLVERNIDVWLGKITAPQVAHFNTPIDGFSEMVPGQDIYSHKHNAYATAVLLNWLVQDYFSKECPTFLNSKEATALRTLKSLIEAWDTLAVTKSSKSIKKAEKEIKKCTDRLQGRLEKLAPKLNEYYATHLSSENVVDKAQAVATKMMAHLVAIQTEKADALKYRPIRPVQEVGLILLLTRLFNALPEINCFSGVDRTGLISALSYALDKLLARVETDDPATAYDRVYDFLMNFEDRVHEMDEKLKDEAVDFDLNTWLNSPDGESYRDLVEFQRWVAEYALGVSIPLVWRSTGFWGLKWRQLIEDNYMVPYLPRCLYDSASQTWFSVVDRTKPLLTEDGQAIFVGSSKWREG